MRSPFGNVVRKDGLLFGKPRKKYTRQHPYPETINRFKPLPREKSAIVILRKHGYSINLISKALGRSRSYVYRTLRFNLNIGNLRYFDMRKLPNKTRKWSSRLRWKTLMELWQKWEAWMLGEGDKPP
jgi:hypothetical protein